VEVLPEFDALECELLPRGLGTKSFGSVKGGVFTKAKDNTWDRIEPLQTVFQRLGLYHDLLGGVEASAIWSRVDAALNNKPIQVTTLLRLLGCDFPHEFDLPGCSVVPISQEQHLHYGSRGRALLAVSHPGSESKPVLDESWYIAQTKTIESTTVAYRFRPPN